MKKRWSSLLLCAAMLVSICMPVSAEEDTVEESPQTVTDVPYLDESGEMKNCAEATTVTSNDTVWDTSRSPSGWYVASGGVDITGRVTVEGDVHLILANGCTLDAQWGITVSQGNSLTIYAQSTSVSAMGKLTATGNDGAGIGGGSGYTGGISDSGSGGQITINGGNVTAEGGSYSAGIGGGDGGAGGNITINGGTVTATSKKESEAEGGAGIGGGYGGAGGNITINGGTVTATSKKKSEGGGGAGIGGGSGGDGGTIIISGGEVTATSPGYSAGIGSGDGGDGGTIIISGGKVTATCEGDGAGIGGGVDAGGGKITISGGTVTAISGSGAYLGGYGAGIGGGLDGDGGTIIISGGTVTATGGRYGAGIGGGEGGNGGEITITGGTVEASSTSGAGIGGGYSGDVLCDGGKITISGGTVTATSRNGGAGIGGGSGDLNIDMCGNGGIITITGGKVDAQGGDGGAGIGGGEGGDGGKITISGGTVTAMGSDYGAGIGGGGYGGDGGEITISGGTVTAMGNGHGAGIGNGGYGTSGSFSTGTNGSAVITTEGIADTSNEGSWQGIFFDGGTAGQVYGSPTLTTDLTIPAGTTLEIPQGTSLTIGEGVTLTNYCTIRNSGTINNIGGIIDNGNGIIDNTNGIIISDSEIEGTILGKPVHIHQWEIAWSSNSTHHWHECPGCPLEDSEKEGYAAHTPGDWIVDQAATSTEAGQRHRECTVCGYVTQTETIPATGGGGGGSGGGYTPPTYKPDVSKPGEGGGTPTVTPSNPKQGSTVTVTPKPDEGYEVAEITVTDRSGSPVPVTAKPDGTYTFVQPAGKVTIEVSYKAIETPWNNPFADVSEDDWYYEAVRFVQEQGLMNGYSDGRFGPSDTLSRAQLAQILFNKEGGPVVNYLMDFSDVAGGAWYTEAIRWAASQGIAGGYGDGSFGPNDPITREQLAVMLWRYVGSPAATNKELHFNDTDEISGYALEALRWAVENGILNGYGNGQLGPKGQATRAQVAQMLKNFIENQEADT